MKLKKILLSPVATVLAFVLAAGLLLFSTVGGARAALTYVSQNFQSQVDLYDIGVTLFENDEPVAWKNYGKGGNGTWTEGSSEQTRPTSTEATLLANLLAEGEKYPKLSHPYREELRVGNSGTINQYVRVTVYRYWADEMGNKRTDLDPGLIDLNTVNANVWLRDEGATTNERTVFYYSKLLHSGDITEPLSDTLTIDGHALKAKVKEEVLPDKSVKVTYDYDGVQFVLEARVDAVQENNAQAAVLSAWGSSVTVDENAGTLALSDSTPPASVGPAPAPTPEGEPNG